MITVCAVRHFVVRRCVRLHMFGGSPNLMFEVTAGWYLLLTNEHRDFSFATIYKLTPSERAWNTNKYGIYAVLWLEHNNIIINIINAKRQQWEIDGGWCPSLIPRYYCGNGVWRPFLYSDIAKVSNIPIFLYMNVFHLFSLENKSAYNGSLVVHTW